MRCDTSRRPPFSRFIDDALKRADGKRLVRLVLQKLDAAALIVIAYQPRKCHDRPIALRTNQRDECFGVQRFKRHGDSRRAHASSLQPPGLVNI